jgi:ABC-2 type transport system permease protein
VPSKILLLQAFFKKEFILFRRYFLNSMGGIITLYVIFLLVIGGFQGIRALTGVGGDTVEGLVVGYVLWLFMLSTYQNVSHTLRVEAQEGTLEQLYMSSHSLGWVMGAKVAAGFFTNLIVVAILLIAALLTTGVTLNVDLLSLLPLLIGTLLGSVGIGFAIGGVTLILKSIESYTQMVQFLLIALVAAPAGKVLWMRLLPCSYGAALIARVMVGGQSLLQIGLGNVVAMFLVGMAHLGLGYGIYKVCERQAMIHGTLGHY